MSRQNKLKISIIMIDGGFRENTFGAKYFYQQDFPKDQFEIIWVDYYDKINHDIASVSRVKAICLNRRGIYHSSYCFNRGIEEARGEIIIIPDADQIVGPDFLSRVWEIHQKYEKLVVYGYRFDEVKKGILTSHDFDELEEKCILKNTLNYGGCLTVRRKWLLKMNGYEQHGVFRTGFHANGMLMYFRFKNMGLAIQWEPSLKLYHPWHPFTLSGSIEYTAQHKVIRWMQSNLYWKAVEGISPAENQTPPAGLKKILDEELAVLDKAILEEWNINSVTDFTENTTQPLPSREEKNRGAGFLMDFKRRFFGSVT